MSSVKLNTAELGLRGAAGIVDPISFDSVYETHAPTVARWVARLGGLGVEIEDVTQEVFLVVNRLLPSFRHESQLPTWLFSITAKVTANDRRRRKIRTWWQRFVPHVEDHPVATGDSPIEQLEKRQSRALFYRVLDTLSDRQRQALVLFELENLRVLEIAEILRTRPGNVRVLLHRARSAFLKKMTEHELREACEWNEPARPERAP